MNLSLVWLRRDLRLHDHAVLATALAMPGQVQPVFIFDSDILARFSNPSDRRLVFLAKTLCQLDRELRARGGGLLVLAGRAVEIMPALAEILTVRQIISAEDFEPATRARDSAVGNSLRKDVGFIQVLDHLLRAPYQVLKQDGSPFKVFTPYSKSWRAQMTPIDYAEYKVNDHERYADSANITAMARKAGFKTLDPQSGPAALLSAIGYRYQPDPLWPVDDVPARLERFAVHKLADYKNARDQLAGEGTSRLSPYLRFGLVSVRECMRRASEQADTGAESWINELIWRDFYAMILYHYPEVVAQEFQPQYRTLPWSQNTGHFAAFCEGRTGYPVVDAAMRQLKETGWMHNRARMVAASFMTKHLQLDWRLGEEYFAQTLMDYDLASNNGGWQWAASVGTDAQPYFRVFNPSLQSVKFDPEGAYIRQYIPELRGLNNKEIHAPSALFRPSEYPAPMVDHQTARDAAIALFRRAKAKVA
jgi:deoxyribodipyrimidine photo-lyase